MHWAQKTSARGLFIEWQVNAAFIMTDQLVPVNISAQEP